MFSLLNNLALLTTSGAAAAPDLTKVTSPIISLLNTIFSAAIPVVLAVGGIYCIVLGVKLAKAEEQQDREKAKSQLKNAIIGFVLIFVLVVVLNVATPIMGDWMKSFM